MKQKFIYKTPYGGVTHGTIKEYRGRTEDKIHTSYIISENNNAYKLSEIEIT